VQLLPIVVGPLGQLHAILQYGIHESDFNWRRYMIYNGIVYIIYEGDISLPRSKLGQGYPGNGKRLLECRGSIDRTVSRTQ